MTHKEREQETIRRLRLELEQRQLERKEPVAQLDLDWEDPSEEQAEVLYELTCL